MSYLFRRSMRKWRNDEEVVMRKSAPKIVLRTSAMMNDQRKLYRRSKSTSAAWRPCMLIDDELAANRVRFEFPGRFLKRRVGRMETTESELIKYLWCVVKVKSFDDSAVLETLSLIAWMFGNETSFPGLLVVVKECWGRVAGCYAMSFWSNLRW